MPTNCRLLAVSRSLEVDASPQMAAMREGQSDTQSPVTSSRRRSLVPTMISSLSAKSTMVLPSPLPRK